jgi:chromatin remodeling complex protein RSC6
MSSNAKPTTKAPKTTKPAKAAAEPAAKTEPKAAKKPKAEKAAPAPVSESVAPIVESEAAVAPVVEQPTAQLAVDYYSKLTQLSAVIAALKSEFKSLEKKYARDIKVLEKLSSKKHRKRARTEGGDDSNTGFKKPTKMSAELSAFFDMPAGSLMARTDATKGITKYVREHTLQRADNKRFIEVHRDAKLKKLLKVPDDVELSFFNLQTFMTKHFAKKNDDAFVNAYP